MEFNNRILLVDDNQDIHRDFRKVLEEKHDIANEDLEKLVDALFDEGEEKPQPCHVQIIVHWSMRC